LAGLGGDFPAWATGARLAGPERAEGKANPS